MLKSKPLILLEVEVGKPVDLGKVDGIGRRFIPITGGSVDGAYCGSVLPGGADWQEVGSNGNLEIDAHYVIELEEGRVEVRSRGVRAGPPEVLARLGRGEAVPATEYYFRTFIRFKTASSALSRLNHILAIASGERQGNRVILAVHEVS